MGSGDYFCRRIGWSLFLSRDNYWWKSHSNDIKLIFQRDFIFNREFSCKTESQHYSGKVRDWLDTWPASWTPRNYWLRTTCVRPNCFGFMCMGSIRELQETYKTKTKTLTELKAVRLDTNDYIKMMIKPMKNVK